MKTIVQTSVILLALIVLHSNANGQTAETHEFGIQFSNLISFSAIYKKERAENKYVRVQVGGATLSRAYIQDQEPNKNLTLSFSGGIENRKPLGEKTNFIHGFAPHVSLFSRDESGQKQSRTQVGIAYILGVQYLINDDFYISLESMPSISGFVSKVSISDTQVGGSIGFYNNIATVTLAHRFKRAKRTTER